MTVADLILFAVAVIVAHGLLGCCALWIAYKLENASRARRIRHLPDGVEVPY